MFGTREWRGSAVVGGDGIEPPTSTERADTVDEVGPQNHMNVSFAGGT
jgi:hypothetical protein